MLGREGIHLKKWGKSMFANRSHNLVGCEGDLALALEQVTSEFRGYG